MRVFRATLLLILLSYSIIIQNYNPVSCGLIGISALSCGCLYIPRIMRGFKQTGYFFATLGYVIEVKCRNYVKLTTIDDIKDGKYVDINLASTKHSDFILMTEQQDDEENKRTNLMLYHIKSHDHERFTKGLTIGCVRFYCRKLQCNLKYHSRTVLTYLDELNRKCIEIESFDESGHRIMRRIYRERSCAWWYDMIVDDKETLIQSLNPKNWTGITSKKKYDLDLNSAMTPPFISKIPFFRGNYFSVQKTGGDLNQIQKILFANQPLEPSKNITDLQIWHYFKSEDGKTITSYVVVCEFLAQEWICKYHKCVSQDQREFKAYDSFSVPFDENIKFEQKDLQQKENEKFVLKFDLRNKTVPDSTDKLSIHFYPSSNHYVLRPRDLAKINLIDSVQLHDGGRNTNIKHNFKDNFRFISVKKYGDEYFLSFTAFDSTNLDFNTTNMKKENHTSREYFYEVNTRSTLDKMISPYYMNLSVLGKEINVDFLDLDLKNGNGILTAKLNDNVTFYSNLYSDYKVLKNLKLESETFDVNFDINSQVFYCETQDSNFVVISHSNYDPTIIKKVSGNYKLVQMNNMQGDLSKINLNEILTCSYNNQWKDVKLDLNDVYISEDIEVLTLSYNTVLFKTPFGKRISVVNWLKTEIKIDKGWSVVTKIKYMNHNFLLVDVVQDKKISRQLYKIDLKDSNDSKVMLMSNKNIDFVYNNLDKLSKDLAESIHDLYPDILPVKLNFDNPKVDVSEFSIDDMIIAYSNSDLLFTPGDISVHGKEYPFSEDHKWRQIFKSKGSGGSDFYSIFTLTKEGMFYNFKSSSKEDEKKFLREPFKEISGNCIPLLVESVYWPGVKSEIKKVGKNQILTFKSEDSAKVLNPIIFGRHEIKLIGGIKRVDVTKSFDAQKICSISIESYFQDGTKGTLTFTQTSSNSDKYELKGDKNIEYQDDFIDVLELTKDQIDQQVLDFNKSKYPLDLRFMILNDNYFYFTGYTREDLFKIKFGEEEHIVPKMNTRYHIWVRYPYANVTTCVFLLAYMEGSKLKIEFQKHDNSGSDLKIEKPEVKFNWGILSNMESLIVNRNILTIAGHSEDFFPVDLDIEDTQMPKFVINLKIDDNTSVYTTVSKSKCIINEVKYKNVIVKGVPKQIAKQVFFSKVSGEVVIVVATKTVSEVLVNGYVLKDNTFEMVGIDGIECSKHKGLEHFNMCKLSS